MRIKTFLKLSVCGALAGLTISSTAHAQVDSSADAGRVEQQFQRDLDIPDLGESMDVQRAIIQNAPPNADQIKFTLNALEIDGVSAYQEKDLAPLYKGKVGTTVSLAEVYAIANRLTTKYRNEGYILTQVVVPPQTIEGGRVQLRVIEGYVDRVVVEGDDDPNALALVREYAGRINTGNALNLESLEKYLLLINDLPGVSARSILSPSKTQAGASDLRIIVSRDTYDALLAIDSFGSRYLGPVQITAGGAVNSLFGNNEKISGQFVASPFGNNDPELLYGSLAYEQPINSAGTKARVFLSHSDTEPGYDIDIFDVKGRSTAYGFGLEHALIRSRNENLYFRGQFDVRNVDSRSDIDVTRKDRIRAFRVGGRYEFLDTFLNVGVTSIDIEYSKGLDVLGASDRDDDALTRAAGDPEFHKFNLAAQTLQRVTSDINVLVGFNAQLSNNALLSAEEFGVGGINVGRGYDASEIVGEEGYSTKVELQWDEPIESAFSGVEDYQVYGFWDFGKVWNDDATIDDRDESLASTGLGVRASFINNYEGGIAVAIPLTRDVQTMGDDDARYYFNLSKSF